MNRDVPIKEYEELYSVSPAGEVISKRTGKKMIPSKNHRGYKKVKLSKPGEQKTVAIHRMVAEAFIPRTDMTLQVDHIDNDKTNNNLSNLQWLTPSENVRKSFQQGRVGSRKGQIMGKNMMFYVSKDNEDRLRELQREGESMSGVINELLHAHFAVGGVRPEVKSPWTKTPTPKNMQTVDFSGMENKIGATPVRSKGDVLADIRQAEADRDEELRFCQDADESQNITKRYSYVIQPLWDKYNSIKGE